jgi:hypothetical protein
MTRIRRWFSGKGKKLVWSEPQLPPYVKINPDAADPGPDEGLQPGDLSMGAAAREFLDASEDENEAV